MWVLRFTGTCAVFSWTYTLRKSPCESNNVKSYDIRRLFAQFPTDYLICLYSLIASLCPNVFLRGSVWLNSRTYVSTKDRWHGIGWPDQLQVLSWGFNHVLWISRKPYFCRKGLICTKWSIVWFSVEPPKLLDFLSLSSSPQLRLLPWTYILATWAYHTRRSHMG